MSDSVGEWQWQRGLKLLLDFVDRMYIIDIYMKDFSALFDKVKGFQWDEANAHKNWEQHQVFYLECEEIFFNEPIIVVPDNAHSQKEDRYFALGKTDLGRLLFIVFTVRRDNIRVISARDMNKKERRQYSEKT